MIEKLANWSSVDIIFTYLHRCVSIDGLGIYRYSTPFVLLSTGVDGHISSTLGISLDNNLSLAENITTNSSTKTKVRLTTQSAKDIANVIGSINTLSKSTVPTIENALDNLDTSQVKVSDGRQEGTLHRRLEQVVSGRAAEERTVKVRGGSHDDDSLEIDEFFDGCAEEGFEGCVVLLGSRAVISSAICDESCEIAESLSQKFARVVDVRGSDITLNHTRTTGRGTSGVDLVVGVQLAVSDSSIRVVECCLAGEVCSNLLQVLVELKDLGTVDILRVLRGSSGTKRNVASGKVSRDIARVEFVLKSDLDGVTSDGNRADGSDLGVDSSNTGNHEVGSGQVEARATNKRGDRDCSIDLALASDDLANISILGTVDMREQRRSSRKRDVSSQEVELGDSVPDLSLGTEHGNEHDLWLDDIFQCSFNNSDRLVHDRCRNDGAQTQEGRGKIG
jgi:hypothetical protein